MKTSFSLLRSHFLDTDSVQRDELFHFIGRPELIPDPNFYNTCAIRLSLALLGAGFPDPGSWTVMGGKYKGRGIETRQRRLSHWLVSHLGKPESYNSGREAENKMV
jgi:hypothetical protein